MAQGIITGYTVRVDRKKVGLGLMVLAQLILLMWLNQLDASTYLAQTVQTWEQGRFIRFHGLSQWLSWLWPWTLLAWGLTCWVRQAVIKAPAA